MSGGKSVTFVEPTLILKMELSIAIMAVGLILVPVLSYIEAPYGKFYRSGFGLQVDGKLGWLIFECVPWIMFLKSLHLQGIKSYFVFCWMVHYLHRSLVYTWLAPSMKPTAITAVLGAVAFNIANGYNNTEWIQQHEYANWHTDLRCICGSLLFWSGMYINIKSDYMLFELKKQQRGYQIPRGLFYNYVSCPNYLGEIIEWTGWAVMTWSWSGVAFLVFTCANLIPRASKTHQWYVQKFANYPKHRKAVIPFLY
jgi:protein-S-isoprenylcysteine O-methyltransferase Ste14